MKMKRIYTWALLCGMAPVAVTQAKGYTNFVVILMDDMGYGDLRINGATGYDTPNIDRMLGEKYGVHPLLCAAGRERSVACRAADWLLSQPYRAFRRTFPGSRTGISADEMTIAEVLKQKGYACGAFGKWHLGDNVQFLPLQHGFDEFYGIPYSNDMYPGHPSIKFPDLPLIEGNQVIERTRPIGVYDNLTGRAVRFIDKHRREPFFLYLAHPMPHVPLAVSDRFKGKSERGLYGDVMMELDWSIGEILKKLKKENWMTTH